MAMEVDAGRTGKKGRGKPEMNVTPLVDVVLVLLIVFMVAMPAMHRLFRVHVPAEAESDTEQSSEAQQPIVVSVNEAGQIRINREVVADGAFAPRLRRMLVARRDRKIYFDADDDARFERAMAVMDLARGAGAAHIAVLTAELR